MGVTMDKKTAAQTILRGETVLGIELGSTRIKAILLGGQNEILAQGSCPWENSLVEGIWTYPLEEVWGCLQRCYRDLAENIKAQYDLLPQTFGAIGISAMMHGYLVFDRNDSLLVPFRTWRNTMTEPAAKELTALFAHQIPQRWSVAHLYQSILDQQDHVPNIRYMTTLSGYIHWMLCGEKVLGIDDASGMFPVDPETKNYCEDLLALFDAAIKERKYPWQLQEILPRVLVAGEPAGVLSARGAKLLDPAGNLMPGIPLCPPAGDAGTGMVATNSIKPHTGNVSAGTSIFSMIVLEKKLSKVYPEIDVVATPEGDSVAMVHCNNCTSDLNGWMGLFREFCETFGFALETDRLYDKLFQKALEGDADCGGLLAYNYLSGEHITQFNEGRPLFVREQNASFTLANFMRAHLFSSLSTLKLGNDLLIKNEGVRVDTLLAHGGLFKTPEVGQKLLAAAMDTPISVMQTAGEGGAWGIALLASYMLRKKAGERLADFLDNQVFSAMGKSIVFPRKEDAEGFKQFIERYQAGFPIEKAAIQSMK